MTTHTPSFFASCPKGLEGLVLAELNNYSPEKTREGLGGILFQASNLNALRFLLNTRIASRVYKRLTGFPLKHEKQIYDEAKKFFWTKEFSVKQTFKIQTLLDHDAKRYYKNSMLLSQILKDSIVDQFREVHNDRPNVDTKNPDLNLLMRIEANPKGQGFFATIYLDLSGDALSSRGYRDDSHLAPVRENLAAAIIMHSDWKPQSDVLIDSMCGSGTFLIEAALIKAKIAPSYLRVKKHIERKFQTYAFFKHHWYEKDRALQTDLLKEIMAIYNHCLEALNSSDKITIFGADISALALEACDNNIRKSLLKNHIKLDRADATTLRGSDYAESGVILCNPPYGERLGEAEALGELYHNYGENLKKEFKNYRAYILTSSQDLRKNISLKTKERTPFWNGPLETRLIKYELY